MKCWLHISRWGHSCSLGWMREIPCRLAQLLFICQTEDHRYELRYTKIAHFFFCPQVVPPLQRLSSTELYSCRRKLSARGRWRSGIGSECVYFVCTLYVNVVFSVSFGVLLLLLFHIELQEPNKFIVIYTVYYCLLSTTLSTSQFLLLIAIDGTTCNLLSNVFICVRIQTKV